VSGKAWAWVIGIVVVGIILVASGPEEDDDSGSDGATADAGPQFTQPKVTGQCPGPLFAGEPGFATFKVTPKEDWPALYVSLFGGEDLVDAASLDGAPGKDIGMPSIETYELAGGAEKDKPATVKLALLGVEGAKEELEVMFWGARPKSRDIPIDFKFTSTCDVTIIG
jgi:hypothetical protein